jgi:hypothetical protein
MFGSLMDEIPGRYRNAVREQQAEQEQERMSLLDQMCNDPKPIYYVVEARSTAHLQRLVMELLERGMWQLQGGVQHYKDGYGEHFIQAMYKPAKPVEPENHLGEVEFRV